MDSNGIVKFEIEGVEHTLYFGMKAMIILDQKRNAELYRLNKDIKEGEEFKAIEDIKAFIFIMYSGLCNNAEKYDLEYPEYSFAYELSEKILMDKDKDIQRRIVDCFNNSKAKKELLSAFIGENKEPEETQKKKKRTGTK